MATGFRRRVPVPQGRAALSAWRADADAVGRTEQATAVRYTLEELAVQYPGRSVEVRVPPFGAVQCIQGPRHSRGTPSNVVETDAGTWLGLVTGAISWEQARQDGVVRASGQRSDLAALLPLALD